jgi:hypothetical protein
MSNRHSNLFRIVAALSAAALLVGILPLGVAAGPDAQRVWTATPGRYTNTPPPPPPPRATRPPTRTPTKTPTPTPTRPPTKTPTPTATHVLADSPIATLIIQGCNPDPSQISVRFVPLGMLGPTNSDTPTGGSRGVGVARGGLPGMFVFQPIPGEAGRLYRVRVTIDSPDCHLPEDSAPEYWTPGDELVVNLLAAFQPELLGSSIGEKAPGYQGEIYMGVWVNDVHFYGKFQGKKQTFEWQDKLGADGGLLQASLFPFDLGGDTQAPPGLIGSWDVTCANCVFTVDLSSLAAYQPVSPQPSQGSPNNGKSSAVAQLLATLIKKASAGVNEMLVLVGLSPDKSAPGQASAPVEQVGQFTPAGGVTASKNPVPYTLADFYFRVVPRKGGSFIAPPSTMVRLHWDGDQQPPLDMDLSCLTDPSKPTCPPTPTAVPKPYIIDIIGYHGWINPKNGHEGCFIVTKTTTVQIGYTPYTYKAGTHLCKPPPKEKSLLEKLGDLASGALGWISEAYNDLQDAVVSIISNFIPSSLCSQSCLKTLLQTGLAAMGIPPSIPNFDAILNGGMDYFAETLAEQAVASVGVPPELTQGLTGAALEAAKDKFKEELQAQIKQGLQAGLEEMQYALSKSVSYVPDGVPVKPDPEGDYQMPQITLRITRDPAVPESADTCKGSAPYLGKSNIVVLSYLIAKINPGGGKFSSGPDLKDGGTYQLYESRWLPLPDLALGESIEVPVVLKPAILWGTPGGYAVWSEASQAWSSLYYNGTADMSASNPCAKGDSIQLPAVQSY